LIDHGSLVLVDELLHPVDEHRLAVSIIPSERLVGEHVLQGRTHRRHRQRVAGEGAADAAHIDQVEVGPRRALAANSADRP
jgi:hypothetical protein